jgi:hypothetical protein
MKDFPETITALLGPNAKLEDIPEHHLLPNYEQIAQEKEIQQQQEIQKKQLKKRKRIKESKLDLSRIAFHLPFQDEKQDEKQQQVSYDYGESVCNNNNNNNNNNSAQSSIDERADKDDDDDHHRHKHDEMHYLRYRDDQYIDKSKTEREINWQYRWREKNASSDSRHSHSQHHHHHSQSHKKKTHSYQDSHHSDYYHSDKIEEGSLHQDSSLIGSGLHYELALPLPTHNDTNANTRGAGIGAGGVTIVAGEQSIITTPSLQSSNNSSSLAVRSSLFSKESFLPIRPLVRIQLQPHRQVNRMNKWKFSKEVKMNLISLRRKEELMSSSSSSQSLISKGERYQIDRPQTR